MEWSDQPVRRPVTAAVYEFWKTLSVIRGHTLLMIDQRQRASLEPDPELQRTLDTMEIAMEKGVLALAVLAP